MEYIRKVAFCPHCCNKAPQKLIHTQHSTTPGWTLGDGEEVEMAVIYFIVVCETCNSILLYCSNGEVLEEGYFDESDLVYPEMGELHFSVPEKVRKIYSEAFRVKRHSRNAFAVQIRRALEALCEDRNAKGKDLQQRLSYLVTKGDIPTQLSELTEVIRLLGNIGAHADSKEIKIWQVRPLDDFFRVVVEYVYVAPRKLKDFRDGLDRFKAISLSVDEQSESIH